MSARDTLGNQKGFVLILVLMMLAVTTVMMTAAGGEAVHWHKTINAEQDKMFGKSNRLSKMAAISMIYSRLMGSHKYASGETQTGFQSAVNYIQGKPKSEYASNLVASGNGQTFTDLTVGVNLSGTTKNLGNGFLIKCDQDVENWRNSEGGNVSASYRVRNSVDIRKPADPTLNPDPDAGTIMRTLLGIGLTVEICRQDGCSESLTAQSCDVVFTMAFLSPFDYPIFIEETLTWGSPAGATISWGDFTVDRGMAYFGAGAEDPNDLIALGEVFHTPKEKDRIACDPDTTSNCVFDNNSATVHGGDWPRVLNGSQEHDIDNHVMKIPFPEACKKPPDSVGSIGKECYKPFTDLMNCIDNCKNPPGCGTRFDNGGIDGMISCKWDDNSNGTIEYSEPYTDDTTVASIGAGWAWTAALPTFNGNVSDSNAGSVPNISLGCSSNTTWATIFDPLCLTGDGVISGSNTIQNLIINGNLDVTGSANPCTCPILGTTTCNGQCKCNPCSSCNGSCGLADLFGTGCNLTNPTCCIPCIPGCIRDVHCGYNVGGTVVVKGNARFRNHFKLNPGSRLYVLGNLEVYDANLSDEIRLCTILPCLEGQLMSLGVGKYDFHVWTKENSMIYVRGDAFIKGADVGPLTEATLMGYQLICSILNPILGLFGISCPTSSPYMLLGPRPNFGGETNLANTIKDDSLILVRGLTPTVRDTNANGNLADENPQTPEGNNLGDPGIWAPNNFTPANSAWHSVGHYKWKTRDLHDLVLKAGGRTRMDLHPGRVSDASVAYNNNTLAARGDLCCHAPCSKGSGTTDPIDFALDISESRKQAIQMTPIGSHVHRHAFDSNAANTSDNDSNMCAALSFPAAPNNCLAWQQDHEAEQYFGQPNNNNFTYWNGGGWAASAPIGGGCSTNTLNANYWGYSQPVFKGHADLELWSYGSPCIIGLPYQNMAVYGTIFSMGSIATNQTLVGLGNMVSMGPQVYPEHMSSMLVNDNNVCDDGYSFAKDKDHSLIVVAGGDLFTAQGLGMESFVCSGVDFNSICAFLLNIGCFNTGMFDGKANYGVIYSNGKAGYEESSIFNANAIRSNGNLMVRHMVSPTDVFDSLEGFCNFFGFSCTVYNEPCIKINEQLCGGADCRYDEKLQQLGFPIQQLVQLVQVISNSPL
ncbi:MAG: hypothetical protein HYT87_07940 [Nitrospirae bacterium]|nr:hypothetical protein [Nitrospirota bacterium]